MRFPDISKSRQLGWLIRTEFLKLMRSPGFSLPTLLLPVGFYLIFGVAIQTSGSSPAYLLATYIVFSAMAPGLFGVGVTLAAERASGWTEMLAVSPAQPMLLLVARLTIALLYALIGAVFILLLAVTIAQVNLTLAQAVLLLLLSIMAALPFACIGLCIGQLVSKGAASAWSNLLFLPVAVLSGLWFPLQVLPELMQQLALVLPAYHMAQLGLAVLFPGALLQLPLHLAVWVLWIVLPLGLLQYRKLSLY
ncbi:MAG: ABC transporter permease [Alishewanella aestuarii]